MGGFADYDTYDGLGLAALVSKGDITPAELLEEAVARAERLNPQINAISLKHYDEAAHSLKAGLPKGPLHGVPFLLKDLGLQLEGTVTTSGSNFFNDVATYDSTLVSRYKAAGLTIFGKTNTPEFGLTTSTEPRRFGPTRNPWNLDHIAGGSSGGAAAAVAAGIVPAANASDGGGSIRIPAAMCGLFGFKPTRIRTPMGPERSEGWNGLSISHVVSRTVRDNAALLDATTGPEHGDLYSAPPPVRPYLSEVGRSPGQLRIAFSAKGPEGVAIHPDSLAAMDYAAKTLSDLGHIVEEADPGLQYQEMGPSLAVLICANLAYTIWLQEAAVGREAGPEDLEIVTRFMVSMGKEFTARDYARATVAQQTAGRIMGAFHETYDVYLQPVTAAPPLEIGILNLMREDVDAYFSAVTSFSPFTSAYNFTGQPSMSIPLYWTKDGLPVGAMMTAAFGRDDMLFRLAGQLEDAVPWFDKRPPVR